jgi:phosphatidylserine/phosphatidylglycerophosphate/cardiolipin synthase-like enzyme
MRRGRPAHVPGNLTMTTTTHQDTWCADMTADIAAAERSIIMTALSCLPPRTLKMDTFTRWWLALADALKRGIAVQIALPKPSLSHPATMRNEAAAADFRAVGATVILIPPTNLLHAKSVAIDSRIAWVGSGNFTAAAAHHNRECYLRTDDARAVAELAAFHARCFRDGAP